MTKINGNDPAFPIAAENRHVSVDSAEGIPIRLWIATQILAGRFANAEDALDFGSIDGTNEVDESTIALHWAEALICAYNYGE